MIQHINIKVFGFVQGVFFRYHTSEEALKLHLTGFVMNQDDGTVYIEAEGKEDDLKELLAWCHKGPRGSSVDKVEFTYDQKLQDFSTFEIRYV
jgi:acylphosphatase